MYSRSRTALQDALFSVRRMRMAREPAGDGLFRLLTDPIENVEEAGHLPRIETHLRRVAGLQLGEKAKTSGAPTSAGFTLHLMKPADPAALKRFMADPRA